MQVIDYECGTLNMKVHLVASHVRTVVNCGFHEPEVQVTKRGFSNWGIESYYISILNVYITPPYLHYVTIAHFCHIGF